MLTSSSLKRHCIDASFGTAFVNSTRCACTVCKVKEQQPEGLGPAIVFPKRESSWQIASPQISPLKSTAKELDSRGSVRRRGLLLRSFHRIRSVAAGLVKKQDTAETAISAC